MDTISKSKRSKVMAACRSRDNKTTELRLLALLRRRRISGWRRHQQLPGRPDFAFLNQRVAVFVDGCFWHGCPHHCRMPKSRMEYWEPKVRQTKVRDRTTNRLLRQKGWRVCRIWEHSLMHSPDRIVDRLAAMLAMANR